MCNKIGKEPFETRFQVKDVSFRTVSCHSSNTTQGVNLDRLILKQGHYAIIYMHFFKNGAFNIHILLKARRAFKYYVFFTMYIKFLYRYTLLEELHSYTAGIYTKYCTFRTSTLLINTISPCYGSVRLN